MQHNYSVDRNYKRTDIRFDVSPFPFSIGRVMSPNRVYRCLYRTPPAVCAAPALCPLVILYLNAAREMTPIQREREWEGGGEKRENDSFLTVCGSLCRLPYSLSVAFFHLSLPQSVFFSATKVAQASINPDDSSQVLFALRKNLKSLDEKRFSCSFCFFIAVGFVTFIFTRHEDIERKNFNT